MVEEAQLIIAAFCRMERVNMRASVQANLVPDRTRQIGVGISAQVQPHAAPVAGGQERRLDVLPASARSYQLLSRLFGV